MTTIDALVRESLSRYPLKTALREKVEGNWTEISYRELHILSNGVAAGLSGSGFAAGDRAAVIGPSSGRWLAAYLGILRAGGIVVPVDKELKSAELRHILTDCEAGFIFTAPSCLEAILEIVEDLPRVTGIVTLDGRSRDNGDAPPERLLLQRIREELNGILEELPLSGQQSDRLRDLIDMIPTPLQGYGETGAGRSWVEDILSRSHTSGRELLRRGRLLSFEEFSRRGEVPEPSHSPVDPALILYTSGTTGRSKGAILSHGNIVSNIRAASNHFNLDSTMHTLSFLPINHVFEQVCGVLLPLSLGGTVSFAESLKKLGENLAEVRPTFFTGVPAVYRLFHDRILKNIRGKALSNLLFSFPVTRGLVVSKVKKNFASGTTFISGGAALDPEIARGLMRLGLTIFQGYGVTETSPVISAETAGRARLGSVGPLLEGVEVRIDGPDGEGVGEIVVRGPNVMQGYFRNPQATKEVLADGWYRTGDLGRLDGDGYLYISGRVKNLIVTPNGKNVYPEEVEIELLKSPFIAEAMVFGHKVDAVSEEVHALIYPNQEALDDYERTRDAGPMTEADVEALIRGEVMAAGRNLADYKRVRKFTLREDEFPKTTTRKIKRFAVEAEVST